jgi:hypothetical protein
MKVVGVFPEPTSYRAPLFDLIAARPGIDLLIAYAAQTVAGRTWDVAIRHPHVFLKGFTVPGANKIVRHDYPITPGVFRLLSRERPEVVVVSGWSTFGAQAAIVWCRLKRVPYLLVVESHDHYSRRTWRRVVKDAVVPRVVRGSAGVLVTGSLVRASMLVPIESRSSRTPSMWRSSERARTGSLAAAPSSGVASASRTTRSLSSASRG